MKKDLVVALVAIAVIGGICYALAASRPDFAPTPSMPASARTGGTPAGTPSAGPSDRVVMRVNGEGITEKEFAMFLEQAPEQQRIMYTTPEGKRALAQELVKLKALAQEGRRIGVDDDPEVRRQVEFGRSTILAGHALRKLVGVPDDQALRAEYAKQRPNLETVDLSHILIAHEGGQVPPRSGGPLTMDVARQKAEAIAARLRGGADFAAMARSESDDVNSGERGGALGPVNRGMLPPELNSVIFGLKEGEISTPTRSPFGIHIFKVNKRTLQSFEEVKQGLTQRLQQAQMESVVNKLQQQAKVDLDPKFFGEPEKTKP